MAKSTRRRYLRRKGRWSANIQNLRLSGQAQHNSRFGDTFTIAQNPAQANSSVSQQYTVKNVEITGYLEAQNYSGLKDITYYIMYVPEGYAIDLDLPFKHPEWIMAYKLVGSALNIGAGGSFFQPAKVKTRLARRLNTGDSIIFLYTGYNTFDSANPDVVFNGLVRWWTKAN